MTKMRVKILVPSEQSVGLVRFWPVVFAAGAAALATGFAVVFFFSSAFFFLAVSRASPIARFSS